MPTPSLKSLQSWLSVVIRHPATSALAIASPAACTWFRPSSVRAGEIVKPSSTQTPEQRLDVYNGGYLARLVEAIESDYRGVSAVLGHGEFHRLVARYVVHHPSRHPNLNRFGKRLPEFLARNLADKRRAFLLDLARLERAITYAFDAPEFTPLAARDLGSVPSEDLGRLVLTPNPSLRIMRFAFPVDPFLAEVLERDHVPALPRRRTCNVAVFRHDGRVWRAALAANEAKVLRALCAGKPLGRALHRVAAPPERIGEWFQRWSRDGFFVAIHT